jgi:hypothetical protein
MADDELERFQAMLGALSSGLAGREDDGLTGARCPKCEASNFVRVSELYEDAVRRLSKDADAAAVVREGGRTDSQIVERLGPPERRSARTVVFAVAAPLGAVAFYLYRRFSAAIGQAGIAGALIITLIVFLTTLRRLSDDYYARRNRWNKAFMCRRCGQLVAGD